MSTRLVPLTPGTAPTIPLQRPVLLIGRHSECDVRIDLAKISRRHCCLALAYDRVVIRDLGSRNGLRVNGLIVEEAQLNPGDEVAIGPLLYRVESEPPLPPPRAPDRSAIPADRPASLPSLPADTREDLMPLI